MKKQRDSEESIVRSGTRIRESVRCLPRGHFQHIRQMFDKQIPQRQQNQTTRSSLSITDDEELQNKTANINDIIIIENNKLFEEQLLLKPTLSISNGNHFSPDILSYTTSSSPIEREKSRFISNQRRRLAMAAAVNYTDSYESSSTSNHLNRIGSTRQYVSSLQRTLAVHAKPVLVKTTCNTLKHNSPIIYNDNNKELFQSSTSLSSTGYDSNSSPSIISKRNSLINNSHEFSSSSDERYKSKPWMLYESGITTPITVANSYSSDNISDSPPLISRSHIKLIHSPTSTLGRRPVSVIHHATIRNSSILDSPSVSSTSSSLSSKYIVQTTSFPDNNRKKHSPAFQNPHRSSIYSPVVVQKQLNKREESPLPIVENPLFQQLSPSPPPQKPPRTFQHENRYDQKVPSSSSSSSSSSTDSSPIFDLGTRSASCMDLTAGVSNVLLSSGLLPLDKEDFIPKEHIYEELKSPLSTLNYSKTQTISNDLTPRIKLKENPKSIMKKGISEPNLAKTKFFSPRSLINRFKRIFPLSSSKQSLNDIDSDDSMSISSEHNDHIRTSRLDHVSRVKNVYDTLGSGSHMTNYLTATRELKTLYDYVVHILPEQGIGYFSNGNGCLSSSNINSHISTSTSIRFKYPLDANDELTLKYFCFPDQYDSNNNNNNQNLNYDFSLNKSKQEYFRFTLTDMSGIRQYGYCSRFIHKGILNALCIVSSSDMMDLYEKILSTATELFLSYKYEDAKNFFKEIYPHRLPNRGDTIHMHTTTVGLYTLKCEYDRRKQLIDSVTLLSLSTDTIIKIFSSILYEQKLIFIGNELGPLTRLINTFVCLLYPFFWPHTYIPILPALMLDIIQAPTPYIIGILRSCEQYLYGNDDLLSQDNSDIIIIDIDHDRIRSINDYLSNEFDNLNPNTNLSQFQILPKMFKIEIKQEISLLRKNKFNLSIDECQQRLKNVFMSIFIQSCYNYKDYFHEYFDIEHFIQSKHHTIELFLEWFTRTQIFQLFIRQKFDSNIQNQFAITFDLACEKYRRILNKQTSQRITVKSVKRKAAIRANNRF